jgi:nucleotide-binding universal stress UspA family protein
MTIVCATRFTEESSFAVTVAAQLARKHRQPLWLVHVLPSEMIRSWGDRLESAANSALAHEAQVLTQSGVEVQTAVLHGKLDDAVGRFCSAKSAALLVVGDTAQSVSGLRAGTLDRLAYGVQTPLLVVRDPKPFQEWIDGQPLKVMLALDGSASSAVARDWLSRLAEYGAVDLVATRVWWPLEEYEQRKLPVPPPEEGHLALSKLMKHESEAALAGLPANVKRRVHLEMGVGRIGEQLLALAVEEQIDVFVLGTHRRRALGRLWSVSHHVLALAPMSVACVPGTVTVADLTTVPAFHTALAATNFTEAGNRAVSTALGVVGRGTVHVVHVSPEPFSPSTEKALLQKLLEVLPPGAEAGGARVLVHALHGEVVPQLLAACEKLSADVVCLGLRAESVRKSSVVSEMLLHAGRPVLIPAPVKA